jgi:molybdenum cofactor guanylyltransferase
MNVTSLILCGGKDKRFGSCKATAIVGGKRIIDRVIERLSPLSSEILVITSLEKRDIPIDDRARIVIDKYPSKGPLGGIYSGLLEAKTDLAIVVGCDMPFINTHLMRKMLGIIDSYDAVIPTLGKEMREPLHAVYTRACIPAIKAHLDNDNLSIFQGLSDLKIRYLDREEFISIDPQMLSFFNVNYPNDLEKANRLVESVYPCVPLKMSPELTKV